MTTGQLVELLKQFKPDTPVLFTVHSSDHSDYPIYDDVTYKFGPHRIIGADSKSDNSVEFKDASICIIDN